MKVEVDILFYIKCIVIIIIIIIFFLLLIYSFCRAWSCLSCSVSGVQRCVLLSHRICVASAAVVPASCRCFVPTGLMTWNWFHRRSPVRPLVSRLGNLTCRCLPRNKRVIGDVHYIIFIGANFIEPLSTQTCRAFVLSTNRLPAKLPRKVYWFWQVLS